MLKYQSVDCRKWGPQIWVLGWYWRDRWDGTVFFFCPFLKKKKRFNFSFHVISTF